MRMGPAGRGWAWRARIGYILAMAAPARAPRSGWSPLWERMQTEDSFFGSVGAMLGEVIRAIVAGLRYVFGGLGSALGDFFSGLAGALGMSPSIFNFALLILGLVLLWAAVKAFLRRAIVAGIFWLVLAMLVLGGLIG